MVTHIPINECNSTTMYDGTITDSMICAGDRKGGKDSCQVCNICLSSFVNVLINQ